MASTSSSSPAPITRCKYDVFLSFRGKDTRYGFTDHLYKALREAGITTFRDVNEIQPGQDLTPGIVNNIKQSKASIIIFSENYATSSWCLDELCLILEQKKLGCFVLPVFYKVKPSDVRKPLGSVEIEAGERSKWTMANVNRWEAALAEVTGVIGIEVSNSGYETDFIQQVVEKIFSELGLKVRSVPTDLTGIERRAAVINSWLRSEQPGSPVLAICGMGGAGKTTLAKYVYSSNKQNFDRSCLLEDIQKQPGGLLGVQRQLLKDISGNNSLIISDVYDGHWHIESALQMNRVLIVVDDIDDKDQLSDLFGTKVFPTRSKIIITTRLLDICTWHMSISSGCYVHKLELLNREESVELLSWHAFGSKNPMKGFEKLAVQLAQYCEGNPLALKVLASSLSVSSQDECSKNMMIGKWISEMNSLDSLKGDVHHKIQVVLRRSFESLPRDTHRELFLHIACFFVGESINLVEVPLEDDWNAKSGIVTLLNRCLITLSSIRRLGMHRLLQNLAYKIAGEESRDPSKRTRVWDDEESYRLLRKARGSETIVGINLNMQGMGSNQPFKTSSLVNMPNLKLLQLYYVRLTGSYKDFPDLRLLTWFGCTLKKIPSGLLMSSLVAVYMKFGDLEIFEPPMVLNSLKILDLSSSHKLVSILSLRRLPKLEKLYLDHCTNLTHICKTMGDLANLFSLGLRGCTKLWNAPNEKIVNPLEWLKYLFPLPQSLCYLGLDWNRFEVLPNYIDISSLTMLGLAYCANLKSLPCLPRMLKALYVSWCTSLENITFQSARFTLQQFYYEGCFKLTEIEGLFKLVPIEKVDEADLGHYMRWVKLYQDHKVDLVGDVITKGRTFNIQMLYEYGIRSTYLQGIKDESMATHEYVSTSAFLSFRVPLHPNKHRIQGLYVTVLYAPSASCESRYSWAPLIAKISNISKGITWVYCPVVYCKPIDDKDIVWLSYWPIGNTLEGGDQVDLVIYLLKDVMISRGCGVSVVYMDDVGEEGRMKGGEEEVIGGDLSRFEVTKGGFYLCRTNIFGSETSDVLKLFFKDDNSPSLCPDSRTWRTSGHTPATVYEILNTYQNSNRRRLEIMLGVSFSSESEIEKIEKAVLGVVGVESVLSQKEMGTMIVVGRVNPQAVATCVSEFESLVQIIGMKYISQIS